MDIAADVGLAVVALLHAYFLVLEMFLWQKPFGRRTFGMNEAQAAETATLAANQGLYNGFLAAGLVWAILAGDPTGYRVGVFFLGCVVVAGLYGAKTVSPRIALVQAAPAAVTLALLVAAR